MSFVRNLFFSVFLGVWGTLSAQEERVIPVPREVLPGTGEFRISEVTAWHTNLSGAEKESLVNYAAAELSTGRQEWHGKDHTGKDVVFFQKISDAGIHPEGYVLEVKPEIVTVSASTATGLFYGLQSLLQLMKPDERGGWTVPAVTVKDSPRFGYRGFMIDVSRHFRPKEFVKKQIDAMARYKLNRLHLHLTDAAGWRIEIKKYPRLTSFAAWRPEAEWKKWWNTADGRKYCEREDPAAQGGYYTQEDIRELVRYAAERHITIIPEIEMPAHSEEVLAAYPGLSCAGEPYKGSDFCVGNEETFTFLENVLTEVMALFPSEYIHIGGDEAGKQAWKSCPKCRRRMADEELKNEDELQSYLICRVEKFLNGHGRKLLGWDEIMEGGLAPNATVMVWRGEEGGVRAVKAGHRVVMTPGKFCYLDSYQDAPQFQPEASGGYLPLANVYSYDPASPAFTEEEAKLIYGVQGNLWAEYIPTDEHYEYMAYPRLLAIAEVAWSAPANKSYPDFRRRVCREIGWLRDRGYHPFPLEQELGERPEAKEKVVHLALGKPVVYNAPYNEHYKAQGDKTLTDGIRGGWTYSDGAWQGFISRDRLDVTIDLGKAICITSVEATFIQVVNPEVFLPCEVIVSFSTDGKNFVEAKRKEYKVSKEKPVCFGNFGWTGCASTRYVRYQARSDKDLCGWLFTDEIIVK
ncbi:beta-N-acetylhexosaminidase [Odoribacter splanchnicus]|jgi:hexosaminidase|uniref:beta-N-acetylhexosaminidase n=1 Tax=Odoribacter splanchnicus TaxID=28118 RepID=UPI0032C0405F